MIGFYSPRPIIKVPWLSPRGLNIRSDQAQIFMRGCISVDLRKVDDSTMMFECAFTDSLVYSSSSGIVQVPVWGKVVHVKYVQGDVHGAHVHTCQVTRIVRVSHSFGN